MSAVTDIGPTAEGRMSMGVMNLFYLLDLFSPSLKEKFNRAYQKKIIKYSDLKTELAEAIIKQLQPIQEKKKYWLKNKSKVQKILNKGATEARKVAERNIFEIKKRMGLI